MAYKAETAMPLKVTNSPCIEVLDRNVNARRRLRRVREACSIRDKDKRIVMAWSRPGRVPRGWFGVAQIDDQA